ncbi:MAG TPA: DUF3631 domain-containing protein [Terracidiphilus sp.]|nr:DUF3631 domain-containing protein [Terracidiphilus sp.]
MRGTLPLFELGALIAPDRIFRASDPLAGVTAEETGPEIAAALELPPAPNVILEAENLIRRFAILPDAAYLPLATWAVATYMPDAFDAFPYIALVSPAKRCGKTRVLELLELLCAQAWRGTSPTAAALYRMMEDTHTLLLDEVEALRGRQVSEVSQAILAVLNAGHRKGATVPRCHGPKNELKYFPVYGPKAFAAIGKLPDTLADRSICITMQRKTAAQAVARFLQSRARAQTEPLRKSLNEWAALNCETVQIAYERSPDLQFMEDRESDLWMPLFAVCAVAAPDRVEELKKCAQALTGIKAADDLEDSLSLKLLADVRSVWPNGITHMLSAPLLDALKRITDSPWGERDRELTPRKLAKMLRPFGPEPRQVRVNSGTGKGYRSADFEQAYSRYLPTGVTEKETCETIRINTGEDADS